MYIVLSSILPIFLLMVAGKIIKVKWIRSTEFWTELEKLSYFLLFPAVLFNYISSAELTTTYFKLVVALMVSTSIISAALVFFHNHYKVNSQLFTSVFQGAVRYNSYIFFGLGSTLYGSDGIVIISVIAAYMIIFTNVLSVLVFTKYISQNNSESSDNGLIKQWKIMLLNLARNPLIFSSILGCFANLLDIEINIALKKFLKSISDSAFAMGLFCVGANLKLNFNLQKHLPEILLSCALKLAILPIITFIILKILGIKGMAYSVGILYSCLPTASNSYLLSRQLGGDYDSMTTIITYSIILSLLSLTILTYVLA